jgi:hypothetical protein
MIENQPNDWRKLCKAASKEEDAEKLMTLVSQINKAPDEHDINYEGAFRGSEPK